MVLEAKPSRLREVCKNAMLMAAPYLAAAKTDEEKARVAEKYAAHIQSVFCDLQDARLKTIALADQTELKKLRDETAEQAEPWSDNPLPSLPVVEEEPELPEVVR